MLSLFFNQEDSKEEAPQVLNFLPAQLRPFSPKLWEYTAANRFEGKVVVVGAGIAGLTAAYYLQQQGVEVELVEADSSAGGRIRTLRGFADFPLDLGAEWLHGEQSALCQWLDQMGAQFYEDDSEELIWFKGRLMSWKEDRRLRQWGYAVEELEDMNLDDISLWQWAQEESFGQEMRNVIEYTANELGTSARRLGVKGYSWSSRKWSAGEIDFKFQTSFYDVVKALLIQPLAKITTLNCPITEIKYHKSKILLKTNTHQFFTADKVLITVPLAVLQHGDLRFYPDLPLAKKRAIANIGIDGGMKIFLKFKERFWADNILGTYWAPSYLDAKYGKQGEDEVLEAFIMGGKADILESLDEKEAIDLLLAELDEIYDGRASAFYLEHFVQNWGQSPYIKGAYSYSSVGIEDSRAILAKSLEQKLYFAGEACQINGHHQTVHGAFESGYEQALRILLDAQATL